MGEGKVMGGGRAEGRCRGGRGGGVDKCIMQSISLLNRYTQDIIHGMNLIRMLRRRRNLS
jgi:hypothetical protein